MTQPTGIGELVTRLEAWGQNSPDPDFFQGDALIAVLADCAAAADALEEAERVILAQDYELQELGVTQLDCSIAFLARHATGTQRGGDDE